MSRLFVSAVVLLLCAGGCSKSEPTAQTSGTGAPTPGAPSAAATSEGEGIPTEEDFEDEAEQKISAQNVEDELDKLEKEITD